MSDDSFVRYIVRRIPARVDRVLRQRKRESGKSLNQVLLEALIAGAGILLRPRRDFSGIAGSIDSKEAKRMEMEMSKQRKIDPELWK